ncbi:MAG: DUF3108 domain-containing protein [Acidobacteria bacterium]|nr:MAG: DUF3108 domain-containing protein [Acidobacteriota bacterium]
MSEIHPTPRMRQRLLSGRTDLQAALQRWRVPLSSLFGAIVVILARPTPRSLLIGGLISLLGLGMRAWAAGYIRKDEQLTTWGPYAYLRHPLYVGSFLLGLGVTVASGDVILVVSFVILFILLFSSAMVREASHLRELFPEEYPRYERAVPAFFPRLTPYRAGKGRPYSFQLYRSHREYRVGFGLAVIIAILLVKAVMGRAASLADVTGEQSVRRLPQLIDPLPFEEGETLVYEARYSKLLITGKIGRITLTFGRSTERPLVGDYWFRGMAVAEGFWPSLLGLDLKYEFESFVNPSDFDVHRTRKQMRERRRRKFELAVFEDSSVLLIKRDLTKVGARPEVKMYPSPSWVQDVVSGIYYLRALPLRAGQTFEIPVSDSGETFHVTVKVVGRESLKTRLGTFDAWRLEPLIFGEGRLIHQNGRMDIWLADDDHRWPLRARVQGKFGTATIDLVAAHEPAN